jgi:hypothetical protein
VQPVAAAAGAAHAATLPAVAPRSVAPSHAAAAATTAALVPSGSSLAAEPPPPPPPPLSKAAASHFSRSKPLPLISALRQLCGSAALVPKVNAEVNEVLLLQAGCAASVEGDIETLCAASAKLRWLDALLVELARYERGRERVVVVSNFTTTLDIIGHLCAAHSWRTDRLDGATAPEQRQQVIDAFNGDPVSTRSSADDWQRSLGHNTHKHERAELRRAAAAFVRALLSGVQSVQPGRPPDKEDCGDERTPFVLLLSAKAGGCGLNLVGASRLVLFDVDWNPAVDEQAMARIWRDGQRAKKVFIYRLLTTGTIEEKIFQRQLQKRNELACIGGGGSDNHKRQKKRGGAAAVAGGGGGGSSSSSSSSSSSGGGGGGGDGGSFTRAELDELFKLNETTYSETAELLSGGNGSWGQSANIVDDAALGKAVSLSAVTFVHEDAADDKGGSAKRPRISRGARVDSGERSGGSAAEAEPLLRERERPF